MKSVRKIISELGWQGWTLLLCGMVAILIAVFDFSQVISLTTENALRLIIVAVGLVLGAIAAQTARRNAEIIELKQELAEAIGTTESLLLAGDREFAQHLVTSVTNAQHFVWDTVLNRAWPSPHLEPYFSGVQEDYKRLLYDRIRKGELGFRRVELIFHRISLEQVMQRLLIHDGLHFYIRYYKSPPTAVPIVNLMSFDGERFYFGAFHVTASPGADPILYIRDPKLAKIYKDYWNSLWSSAIPLNEGRVINWKELQQIATQLEIPTEEFDSMIKTVKEKVEREKRKLRLK